MMRFKFKIVFLFVFISAISYAQDMTSEKMWNSFVKAVNLDYVDAQVKQIDLDIDSLYNRLDSKCTNKLLESTKRDIYKLNNNKFITERQKLSLNRLKKLLDNYRDASESFKSIFVQKVDDPIINALLKMDTIDSQQAYMMAKAFWNIYETKIKDLTYHEEYKYLNAQLKRFNDIFIKIINKDSSLKPESYLETLQEALKIESELIEEHTTYFEIK